MARCCGLLDAGRLVLSACPGVSDIDTTLEAAGFITALQRTNLAAEIARLVDQRGCSIDSGTVPSGAATSLRDIRQAVFDNATRGEDVKAAGS